MRDLMNYTWPGNIRELENVIEHAIIISEKGEVKLRDVERNHIIQVLESTNWRLGGAGGAAELLGLKRTTLHEKIKNYGIKQRD